MSSEWGPQIAGRVFVASRMDGSHLRTLRMMWCQYNMRKDTISGSGILYQEHQLLGSDVFSRHECILVSRAGTADVLVSGLSVLLFSKTKCPERSHSIGAAQRSIEGTALLLDCRCDKK